MKRLYIFIIICLLFSACNKQEGEGGTGAVQGTVYLVHHPDDCFDLHTDTLKAAKADVFIIYGDSDYFNDDVETDYNGFYKFKYLNAGTYTIFAYSTKPSGEKIAVKQTITIKRGETGTVNDIYIHDGKAYGTSIIKGTVMATYIDGTGNEIENTVISGYAYNQRVFLKRASEDVHFDDTRTGIDGVYAFQKIEPGEYEVFTVSVTQDGDEIPYIVKKNVTVSQAGEIVEAPTLSVCIKP